MSISTKGLRRILAEEGLTAAKIVLDPESFRGRTSLAGDLVYAREGTPVQAINSKGDLGGRTTLREDVLFVAQEQNGFLTTRIQMPANNARWIFDPKSLEPVSHANPKTLWFYLADIQPNFGKWVASAKKKGIDVRQDGPPKPNGHIPYKAKAGDKMLSGFWYPNGQMNFDGSTMVLPGIRDEAAVSMLSTLGLTPRKASNADFSEAPDALAAAQKYLGGPISMFTVVDKLPERTRHQLTLSVKWSGDALWVSVPQDVSGTGYKWSPRTGYVLNGGKVDSIPVVSLRNVDKDESKFFGPPEAFQ